MGCWEWANCSTPILQCSIAPVLKIENEGRGYEKRFEAHLNHGSTGGLWSLG
jgi:hypothetical protein